MTNTKESNETEKRKEKKKSEKKKKQRQQQGKNAKDAYSTLSQTVIKTPRHYNTEKTHHRRMGKKEEE